MTVPGTWKGKASSTATRGRRFRLRMALADVVEGALLWPHWFTLGNIDIKLRFRRTGLGPIWTTLSFSVLALALGVVYGAVFQEDVASYLPYVVVGLFVWGWLATTLTEACEAFIHAEPILKQLYVARTTLIYRGLWRNLVLLGFNFAAVAIVLVACRVTLPASAPLALAGLALLLVNLAWLSLLLALATTRYRAISRIVQTALPIGMLVTPVIWRPLTPRLAEFAAINPLFHAVELVRGPLLASPPGAATWLGAAAVAAMGSVAAFFIFAAARPRIPYWL